MTSSTDSSRAARSGPSGTSNGTPASRDRPSWPARSVSPRSVPAPETRGQSRRCVRPPIRRNVMRHPGVRRQHRVARRRRSAGAGRPRSDPGSAVGLDRLRFDVASGSNATLLSKVCWRRSTSISRRLATVINHAPGLRGTPADGHCSSAATNASCATSSANDDVVHDPSQPSDQPRRLDPPGGFDRRPRLRLRRAHPAESAMPAAAARFTAVARPPEAEPLTVRIPAAQS